MSDENSPLISLPEIPDSVDKAVKNLTDKPTQVVGQTLSDIWYLVFGGITQAADKRRMKYAHDLEIYKQELSQAIASIPKENLVEPNIQTTAQALENSKYCVESKELRTLFVNLISKSINSNFVKTVHPSFAEIIKQMSPLDARILKSMYPIEVFPLVSYYLEEKNTLGYYLLLPDIYLPPAKDIDIFQSCTSICSLKRFGLIKVEETSALTNKSRYEPFEKTEYYKLLCQEYQRPDASKTLKIKKYFGRLTPLGKDFLEVCVDY